MPLSARVRAAPEDRQLLAIWADALTEAGDPRGELVALSLAGRDPERQERLIRDHRPCWLGEDLDRALSGFTTWRHGLLDALELRRCPDEVATRAADSPELHTATRLRRGHASLACYLAFAASPRLVRLTDLQLHPHQLSGSHTLTPVGPIDTVLLEAPPDPAALERLGHAPGFSGLRHVEVAADRVRRAQVPDVVHQLSRLPLRTLRVSGYPEEVLPLFFDTDLHELWVWAHGLVRSATSEVPALVQRGWSPPGVLARVVEAVAGRITHVELHDLGTRTEVRRAHAEDEALLARQFPGLEVRRLP